MNWRKIPGFDGYEVSDTGVVRRISDNAVLTLFVRMKRTGGGVTTVAVDTVYCLAFGTVPDLSALKQGESERCAMLMAENENLRAQLAVCGIDF